MFKSKLSYQCKLCKLIKLDQSLWVEIHKQILEDGISKSVVCKYLNRRAKNMNIELAKNDKELLPSFNQANFTTHFQKHINVKDDINLELNNLVKGKKGKGTTAFSDTEHSIADGAAASSNIVSEYAMLADIIRITEQRIHAYNKNLTKKEDKGQILNFHEITNTQRLLNDLLNSKQSLSKLRSMDQLATLAIKSAMESMITLFSEGVIAVGEEIRTVLEEELPGTSLPTQIVSMLRNKLSDDLRNSVESVQAQLEKDYGI